MRKIDGETGRCKRFRDSEYFRYRMKHSIKEVFDENGRTVLVKTEDGFMEEEIKPHWILKQIRNRRQN